MAQILFKARLLFLLLLILVTYSTSFTISNLVKSGRITEFTNYLKKTFVTETVQKTDPIMVKITPSATPKQTILKTNAPQTKKECFRALAIHLDGSTSNLCYSKANSTLINSLRSDYYSAKTFYEFHIDGAKDYQQTYERTGSSIYLDAKASQEQQAQNEKQKMNLLVSKMQEIERRGY